MRVDHRTIRVARTAHKAGGTQSATVGQCGVGLCQLQWRGIHAVAVGQGRLLQLAPVARRRQLAAGLAGESAAADLAKAKSLQHVMHVLVGQGQRDLGGAHVAGLGDHARDVDQACIAHVTDHVAGQGKGAGRGVDGRVRMPLAAFQRRRDDEWLHCRAGLDQVGQGAVAAEGRLDVAARVGVERGLVDHGQHLASLHVQHDHGAGPGAVLADGGLELAVGQVLDAPVDRQGQVTARLRLVQQLDIFHHMAKTVTDDTLLARLARQPVVKGQLQTLLATVVDVGEAQHMRHGLAVGIEAAELALAGHAGDAQAKHLGGRVRVHVAAQPDELARGPRLQLRAQLGGVGRQRLRQLVDALVRLQQLARVGPDGVDRRGHRQWLAVAVKDGAA